VLCRSAAGRGGQPAGRCAPLFGLHTPVMHDCEHDCPSEPSCVTLFSICWLTRYSCRVLCEANRELAITWQWSCWNNQAEGNRCCRGRCCRGRECGHLLNKQLCLEAAGVVGCNFLILVDQLVRAMDPKIVTGSNQMDAFGQRGALHCDTDGHSRAMLCSGCWEAVGLCGTVCEL